MRGEQDEGQREAQVESREDRQEGRGKGVLGLRGGEEEGHDGQHERARPARPARRAPRLRGWAQLVRVPEPGTGSWPRILAPRYAPPSRMRGARAGRLNGGERSRMGDAFRPPSPAPFGSRYGAGPTPGTRTGFGPAKLRPACWPVLAESLIAVVQMACVCVAWAGGVMLLTFDLRRACRSSGAENEAPLIISNRYDTISSRSLWFHLHGPHVWPDSAVPQVRRRLGRDRPGPGCDLGREPRSRRSDPIGPELVAMAFDFLSG
jgi:hypothetical protein